MNENLSPIRNEIKPPIRPNLQYLPTDELTWEEFEKLCLAIVQTEFDINNCESRGIKGQGQQGIDIFAQHDDGTYSVYQCKKYKHFYKNNLDKAVAEFRKGKYFSSSKRFFICVACELNRTQIQDAFEDHRISLKKDNIELIKWDKIQISRILKQYKQIVSDVFGINYAEAFNGEETLIAIPEMKINTQIKFASSDLYSINNNFQNVLDSHINRSETTELYNWIFKDLEEKEANIAVLVGNAGTGKTVILKDLIDLLDKDDIPVLGLKADKKRIDSNQLGKSILDLDANIQSIFDQLLRTHKVVVLLVDQIDALSRSLSTNREQISAYTSLISKISLIKGIRIILSCRIFDLHHDADLVQYKTKKVIKLALLEEKEVEAILKRLTGLVSNQYPKDLIDLLRTPLHLDVFCRIYNDSTSMNEIKSLQDLYRSLWNLKVKEVKLKDNLEVAVLEEILFDIANKIYERQENLSVPGLLFDAYYEEIRYLKSENLIVENNGELSFFHQSFYDYTYARNFVEKKGGNVFDFLKNQNHQGLFIRSVTKQVLAYLRIYNPELYLGQLKSIIFSDDIRYHIKLLIIDMLSFEENPKSEEFKLILSILLYNKNLALSFFNSIPGKKWFYFFAKRKEILLDLINKKEKPLCDNIARYIVFSADHDIETAFQLLSEVKDKKEMGSLLCWALYRVKNFSIPIVTDVYYTLDQDYIEDDKQRLHILSNATKSNPEFAVNEARKIFFRNLSDWNKRRKRESGYHSYDSEFYRFCEDFYKAAPSKAYPFLKEIILSFIHKTIITHPYLEHKLLKDDSAFQDYNPDTYEYHKYIDWIVDYLSKTENENLNFKRKEIQSYLKSNQTTQIFVALQIMHNNPSTFLDEIFSVLTNKDLVEDILRTDDLRYYYRDIITKSYSLFSEGKRNILNEFFLSFFTKRDFFIDKEFKKRRKECGTYKNKIYPFPCWGKDQWKLLDSVPHESLMLNNLLRNRYLMWNRRYEGWSCKNKKPNHHVTMAGISGGLISLDKYKKLSNKQWYRSFLRYDKEDFHDRINRNFSVDGHARAFKEITKNDSERFFPFVSKIISKNIVNIRYQISGLEGLIESEYDPVKLRILYSLLMNRDIADVSNQTSFIGLGSYFIKETAVDRELVDFWKRYIELPFENKGDGYFLDSREDHNDKLFNEGWRSINANAIDLLIHLSLLDSYTEEVYQYLLNISNLLPVQLKLVVLHSINKGSGFKLEQLISLFISYTTDSSAEVYWVAPNLINDLFYDRFEDLIPFIRQTISIPNSAKSLGRYLLYGWFYGFEKSKELLLELHQISTISIIESIVQASEYLHDSKYKEQCLFILNYYAKDNRSSIREGYSAGFYHLTSRDFPSIKKIIKLYISDIDEGRFHSLYHYLFDCAKDYPIDCIDILHSIDFGKILKSKFEIEDPIKLLMLSYNAIREYDLLDSNLEYTMDVFDDLLQKIDYSAEIDKILKEVDCE